ncbi:MAG: hypothetical protein ACJ76M_17865 [Solirubrobacteraceae bacterium]
MEEGQPTRVTPGVPPGVAAETETVREAGETTDGGEQQPQQKAEQIKAQAQQKLNEVKEAAPEQLNQAVSSVQEKARENPLPFAVGGALLAGFLVGRATKRS